MEGLIQKYGQPSDATNADIIDINNDVLAHNLTGVTAAIRVLEWMGRADTNVPPTILKSKIQRVAKKAKTLRRNALEDFLREPFALPRTYDVPLPSVLSPPPVAAPEPEMPSTSLSITIPSPPSPSSNPVNTISPRMIRNTPTKLANSSQDKVIKFKRLVSVLESKVSKLKEELGVLGKIKTRYSKRNVDRREERNVAMRIELRNERRKLKKLAKQREEENAIIKKQLQDLQQQKRKFQERMENQNLKLQGTRKEKRMAEKRAIYFRRRSLKSKEKEGGQERQSQNGMSMDVAGDGMIVETKGPDAKYTAETRLCIMDLLGLEVATGKIAPVMESVARLGKLKFYSLPSRQVCQNIADEGQVLAKSFVKEKIIDGGKFGLHKDGTTRRKVKILDTSVETEGGEAFCLGWSSVSSETGKAIAAEGKEKLEELVEGEEEMKTIVERLSYTMSDRAANEKKSNQCLEEWREEMIASSSQENFQKIHHLYCLAHVLLGFQTYTINGIKKLEKFASSDLKHPIVLVLKDSTDLFGPVGDYRGIRNQWEAFCLDNEVKSTIKAYKDNRFNGLFEVAAQVFHHHDSFVSLLEAQKSLNFKQTRLLKSLRNPDLLVLLECLGLFFHKVTGPFWSITISRSIPINRLNVTIQKLESDLETCAQDPSYIFNPDSFSFQNFRPSSSQETIVSISKEIKEEMKEIIITISNALLSTIRKQLIDFLAEGQYGSTSTQKTLDHISFAPLSNLVCERNFGHLDSSQRRRPHSSLHHHTSIILLKQTRKGLNQWYGKLSLEKKKELWEKATKRGKALRKKHREKDRQAIMESLPVFKTTPVLETATSQEILNPPKLIAVACQDNWYPAVVQNISHPNEDVTVSFAELGKKLGSFKYPTGKDIHTVSRKAIVSLDLEVRTPNNGRTWEIQDAKAIQAKF